MHLRCAELARMMPLGGSFQTTTTSTCVGHWRTSVREGMLGCFRFFRLAALFVFYRLSISMSKNSATLSCFCGGDKSEMKHTYTHTYNTVYILASCSSYA